MRPVWRGNRQSRCNSLTARSRWRRGSIQLFFDNTQVTPTITQAVKGGLNVTTISYVPPALAYGSVHTNRIVYGDQPAPANQYSKEWKFTVYTGDLIFADSYESALPVKTASHYLNAFEGTKLPERGPPCGHSPPDPRGGLGIRTRPARTATQSRSPWPTRPGALAGKSAR